MIAPLRLKVLTVNKGIYFVKHWSAKKGMTFWEERFHCSQYGRRAEKGDASLLCLRHLNAPAQYAIK